MTIHIYAVDGYPYVDYLCNGCGLIVSGCIQDYGGDPRRVARAHRFVVDDEGCHWCPDCAEGPRVKRIEQLSLDL